MTIYYYGVKVPADIEPHWNDVHERSERYWWRRGVRDAADYLEQHRVTGEEDEQAPGEAERLRGENARQAAELSALRDEIKNHRGLERLRDKLDKQAQGEAERLQDKNKQLQDENEQLKENFRNRFATWETTFLRLRDQLIRDIESLEGQDRE